MPTKKQIITIYILCVIALGLGYWSGMPEKGSGQRAEVLAPTVVTNVVTNTLKEVVGNNVTATPQSTPANTVTANGMNPMIEKAIRRAINKPTGELSKADLELRSLYFDHYQLADVEGLGKLKDLEKLTQLKELHLANQKLTEVKSLEKLTQLEHLVLQSNSLTSVKGLEELTQLVYLNLNNNQLTDVKGLAKLTQLKILQLHGNQLTDVKGLETLDQLKELALTENPSLTKAQIDELQKALPNCKITSNPTN